MQTLAIGSLAIFSSLAYAHAQNAPVVSTECGLVKGTHVDSLEVDSFLGIQYAASPIGDLRFADAVALRESGGCWSPNVLNATQFGTFCVQSGQFRQGGGEDCLFLNVWAPSSARQADSEPLPVLAYSYGGDLTDGRTNTYDLGRLASLTNSVVVSMNYRVNIFGFLAAKQIREYSAMNGFRNSSGNYGFTDQITALQWVQSNIKNFGGDPDRVTFFGQSSGGTSVFALLGSPMAKGLFHRVVSLSGSANLTATSDAAEADDVAIVNAIGCGSMSVVDTVHCLRNASIDSIVAAVPQAWDTVKALWSLPPASAAKAGTMGYRPIAVVDGYIVQYPLIDALKRRSAIHPGVSIIISSMAQEADAQPGDMVAGMDNATFQALIESSFAPWGNGAGDMIFQAYGSELASGGAQKALESMLGGYGMQCANNVLGRAGTVESSNKDSHAPLYIVEVSSAPSHPIWGFDTTYQPRFAFHSWDIVAGFDHWDLWSKPAGKPTFVPQPSDIAFGKAWRDMLSTFSKDGNLDSIPGYVPFDHGCSDPSKGCAGTVMNIGAGGSATAVEDAHAMQCSVWAKLGFG